VLAHVRKGNLRDWCGVIPLARKRKGPVGREVRETREGAQTRGFCDKAGFGAGSEADGGLKACMG
jgi:hypothetical protein